jgi:hypothetical protein
MRHYKALLEASHRLQLPRRFRADLTKHDKAFCAAHDEREPFLWLLYNDGTHVLHPRRPGEATRAASCLEELARDFAPAHWFGWDGERLRSLPDSEAAARFLDMNRARSPGA